MSSVNQRTSSLVLFGNMLSPEAKITSTTFSLGDLLSLDHVKDPLVTLSQGTLAVLLGRDSCLLTSQTVLLRRTNLWSRMSCRRFSFYDGFRTIFRWLHDVVHPDCLQPSACAYAGDFAVSAPSLRILMRPARKPHLRGSQRADCDIFVLNFERSILQSSPNIWVP